MLLVHLPEQVLSHIVLAHNDRISLCGRTSWPGAWESAGSPGPGTPLCVACLRIWQTQEK